MSRVFRYILLMFFLAGGSVFYTAGAEESSDSKLIIRPQLNYKSSRLRDPFLPYLVNEANAAGPQDQLTSNSVESKVKLETLVVQGIIWGGKIPQAIINNKVLVIGDLIEGAQILSIDKSGITLNLSGEIISLSAPGQGVVSKKLE